MCTLLLLFVSQTISAKINKVLVLHSYHQGLEWTDSISKGIQSVLNPKFNEIEVYYEYLDSKRNSSALHAEKQIELFRSKNQNITFDLIITSDNNALQFINQYGQQLYPNVPIVFCGVNYFNKTLINNIKEVTGITEEPDFKQTINLMLTVHPKTKKIIVIVDQTETGKAIKKSVQKIAPFFKNRVKLEYYTDFTWNSIQTDIAALSENDLIYLLTINRDSQNTFISYREGMAIVKHAAQVPIYGSWDFYLGKGILGGVITTGFYQGSQAATMALRVLSGESANNIPIQTDNLNQIIFDFDAMQKMHISEAQLPNNANFINKPKSIAEQIQQLPIWVLLSVFSIVILLIVKLILQSQTEKNTLRENEILEERVKDKVSELSNTAEKLNKLVNTLPFPVFYKDANSVYQHCNDIFAKTILGINKDQIIGRTLYDLPEQIPNKLAALYNTRDVNLINNPGTQFYEAKVKCADGIIRDYMFHKATLCDLSGNITGIVGAMLDTTESRKIQQEHEILIKELEKANCNLNQVTMMDSLTAIYNRRYISKHLPEALSQAKRYGYPLSIIMLDIDHFKQINDNFGHPYGDTVLQRISKTMKDIIRDSDFLARYGGEEFLIIMPHSKIDNALIYANRIRKSIGSLEWDKENFNITISGGIAEYNMKESETTLLNRADAFLYEAKSQGRNLIIGHPNIIDE